MTSPRGDTFEDSGDVPLGTSRTNSVDDFRRLERKVDRMVTSLEKLILIEDRQLNLSAALSDIRIQREKDMGTIQREIEVNKVNIEKADRLLQQWIQRGIGAWVIMTIIASVIAFVFEMKH